MQSPIIVRAKAQAEVASSNGTAPVSPTTKSEQVLAAVTNAVAQVMQVVNTAKQVYAIIQPLLVPLSLLLVAFVAVVVVIQAALFVGHMPLVPQLLQTGGFIWVANKLVTFTKLTGRTRFVDQLTELKGVTLGGN
jgi:hypothetical protein